MLQGWLCFPFIFCSMATLRAKKNRVLSRMMDLSDIRTVGTAGNPIWKSTTASSEEGHPLHGGERDSHGRGPTASQFHCLTLLSFLFSYRSLLWVQTNLLCFINWLNRRKGNVSGMWYLIRLYHESLTLVWASEMGNNHKGGEIQLLWNESRVSETK